MKLTMAQAAYFGKIAYALFEDNMYGEIERIMKKKDIEKRLEDIEHQLQEKEVKR